MLKKFDVNKYPICDRPV